MSEIEKKPPCEQGIWSMVADSLRGKGAWMAILVWIYSLGFTGLLIWGIVKFVSLESETEVKTLLGYMAVIILAGVMVVMVKLWYWMLMNRNVILRAIQRLEDRLAKLESGGSGE